MTFTPAVAGKVKIFGNCSAAAGFGSDWGVSHSVKAFVEQSGVTTYGPSVGISSMRGNCSVLGVFDVAAGVLVKCGLWGGVTGAASMTIYAGANVLAEFTPT